MKLKDFIATLLDAAGGDLDSEVVLDARFSDVDSEGLLVSEFATDVTVGSITPLEPRSNENAAPFLVKGIGVNDRIGASVANFRSHLMELWEERKSFGKDKGQTFKRFVFDRASEIANKEAIRTDKEALTFLMGRVHTYGLSDVRSEQVVAMARGLLLDESLKQWPK